MLVGGQGELLTSESQRLEVCIAKTLRFMGIYVLHMFPCFYCFSLFKLGFTMLTTINFYFDGFELLA